MTLTVASVGAAALILIVVFSREYGETALVLLGLGVTVSLTAMQFERQRRVREYERLLENVGGLTVAWGGLKRASGIAWGVESNLMNVLDRNSDQLGPVREESIRRVLRDLRTVDVIDRPTTLESMERMRRDRYHRVVRLNADVIRVLSSEMDPKHREEVKLPEVDNDAIRRLADAYADWDKAVSVARSAVSRWVVLDNLMVRCDALVHYWWVFVQNDPYFRNPKANHRERVKAFSQADEAIRNLGEGVRARNIGHPFWRAWLIRSMLGRRFTATLDAERDLIK